LATQKIAPSVHKIARNIGFTDQGQYVQNSYYEEVPQGFHTVSDVSNYNYAPNPGYQNTQNYNYGTQQGQGQFAQPATRVNPDDMVNKIPIDDSKSIPLGG
jgi:hypothetical protein